MDIEQVADYFERVKMNGRGFTARCPAHDDRNPSLTVAYGLTGLVVKCQVGCSFFEVVGAAGLEPLDFKYDVERPKSESTLKTEQRARRILRDLQYWRRRPLTKFDEIADVAFQPPIRRLVEVTCKYPLLMAATWARAQKMWVVTMDGPVFELLYGGGGYTGNWANDRELAGKKLWETQRRYGLHG